MILHPLIVYTAAVIVHPERSHSVTPTLHADGCWTRFVLKPTGSAIHGCRNNSRVSQDCAGSCVCVYSLQHPP
ncbi:uncharacterized protein BO72DRAFT_171704 [Aspergillus fijiensis CBS 313.89]|uniref:Uncharacterized protein n=1 Tax=Aspergillus fijiensis CBS 313.89 TaxID=1448319 RepID=A0A8G1VWE0_9EURO|nr:uncharacterized protein BO72DRAFT_171704 [Aspergillus fijiensis CBS 313.89]RAK75480.1 hypothetical protein BO72DRAFT_171704 [Aspergillus fijiensis CBS 313.89]